MKSSTFALIFLFVVIFAQIFMISEQSRELAAVRAELEAIEDTSAAMDQFMLELIDTRDNKVVSAFRFLAQELKRLDFNQIALIEMVSDASPAPLPKNPLPPGLSPQPTPADPSTRPRSRPIDVTPVNNQDLQTAIGNAGGKFERTGAAPLR